MTKKASSNLTLHYDPALFGASKDEGLVAVEHVEKSDATDDMILFFRKDDQIVTQKEAFEPFIIADSKAIEGCPVDCRSENLKGRERLNTRSSFLSWKSFQKAKSWLAKKTGFSASSPGAPYMCVNDPVQQHLMTTGRTLFLGMEFENINRMQVDIECYTTPGYGFCNAEREGDRIIAIAMSDQSGWVQVLDGSKLDEKAILEEFVTILREKDPDVIEGHNIFNFDLAYIRKRAKLHKVKLELGRDGSIPKFRPSRLSVGERTLSYERCDIFGRHIVDTLFLVHAYDISHRSLSGFGLKQVAIHFGIAAKNRTYIDGSLIAKMFKKSPAKVMKYAGDDVVETRELSALLSRSGFIQAQMLPYSYQNACVRGNATKIDALMVREYLRQGYSLPVPDQQREYAGGYTDMFVEGVVQNVHHCDIRSLYPSLMLARELGPSRDALGVFLSLLEELREFRLAAKEMALNAGDKMKEAYFDALQSTFKILINSFYGYLGFAYGRFSDFNVAEEVTAGGRELLRNMIQWLKEHGAVPVEIDTDGIYFVPPEEKQRSEIRGQKSVNMEGFRKGLADSLPEGIEVEFDGEYESMYSYKMKNYALLCRDGEVVIKGAALKSRGLEPFQRSFLRELIRLRLEGKEDEIYGLRSRYEKAIRDREWGVEELAKTETLQDAPSTYAAKRSRGKTTRRAVYELALSSDYEYRAGDQISYYVTGEKKSVAVNENSKMVSQWDSKKRDENVPYYLAKLDALYKKFGIADQQSELGL